MKCFIASAFGHSDVDAIYDRCIRRALRESKIIPLRVDRVEHNEDIDKKIVRLMDDADFGIADLTFARPSVYYEAGYLTGCGKPVIFVARKDHFRQRDDDVHGNLSIHFDLRMRNIIDWNAPEERFRRRLERRIAHVVRPLKRKTAVVRNNTEEEASFARMSLVDQRGAIEAKARALLASRGFRRDLSRDFNRPRYAKDGKGVPRIIDVIVQRSFLKDQLQSIYRWSLELHAGPETTFANNVTTVCVSTNPIRRASFRAYFSSYAETENGSLHRRYISKDSRKAVEKSIDFIDRVRSVSDFEKRFRTFITRLL